MKDRVPRVPDGHGGSIACPEFGKRYSDWPPTAEQQVESWLRGLIEQLGVEDLARVNHATWMLQRALIYGGDRQAATERLVKALLGS